MSKIYGEGKPTTKTEGGVGDIYVDKLTGREYKCRFAYKDEAEEATTYDWKEILQYSERSDESVSNNGPKVSHYRHYSGKLHNEDGSLTDLETRKNLGNEFKNGIIRFTNTESGDDEWGTVVGYYFSGSSTLYLQYTGTKMDLESGDSPIALASVDLF